ncbi:type IV secretion protein Rhs, partial [Pseudomonas sp. Bout1]|nr:type IV secretion protein Rhs [Pseudomonas sp. Bout1]
MTASSSHIAHIEHELDGFHRSLAVYRQQVGAWYSQALDKVSHGADLPSLLGMDRIIRVGDSSQSVSMTDDNFSTVVRCEVGGVLEIESKFESVYDVPLGGIPVEVIGLDDGSSTVVMLDEQGKGAHPCVAGRRYRVRVQGGVSLEQVEALFSSYDGLTADLERWLREQWDGFRPHWERSTSSAIGNGLLAGSWAAITGVWDAIKQVQEIFKDPGKLFENLGDKAHELMELARTAPKVMEQAMLLASDEAALYLMLRTAMIWLSALPPSEVAGSTAGAVAGFVVSLLIDLLVAALLTVVLPAAGIAYLSSRVLRYGARIVEAAIQFVKGIFSVLQSFMGAVGRYKTVAVRGAVEGLKKGGVQMRWGPRQNSVIREKAHVDDAPASAKNPGGDAAAPADKTATNGCPVSMVTGEELLTLTDGSL